MNNAYAPTPAEIKAAANCRTLARICIRAAKDNRDAGRPEAAAHQLQQAREWRADARAILLPINVRPKR